MAPTLENLPIEIIDSILDSLRGFKAYPGDILGNHRREVEARTETRLVLKCLRLTCKELHTKTLKHFAKEYFTRVAVNEGTGRVRGVNENIEPKTLEKAHRIATQELFRNSVKELQIISGPPPGPHMQFQPNKIFTKSIDVFVSQTKYLVRLDFGTTTNRSIPLYARYHANGYTQALGSTVQHALCSALYAIRNHRVHLRDLRCVNRNDCGGPTGVSLLDACDSVAPFHDFELFDQLDTLTIGGIVFSHRPVLYPLSLELTTLKALLLSAPRLTALHLGGHCRTQIRTAELVANASECFAGLRFLKTLALDMMRFQGEGLSRLLRSCPRHLEKLHISSIGLERETWDTVFTTIADHFELSWLDLSDIREGQHGHWVVFELVHRARFKCFLEDNFEEIDNPPEPTSPYIQRDSIFTLFYSPPQPSDDLPEPSDNPSESSDSLSEPFMVVAQSYRNWEQRTHIQIDRDGGDDMREWLTLISDKYGLSSYPADW
jgi:hypothetical protein